MIGHGATRWLLILFAELTRQARRVGYAKLLSRCLDVMRQGGRRVFGPMRIGCCEFTRFFHSFVSDNHLQH